MNMRNECFVISVGNRFFHDYKNKRIQTAWSLAGAKLFLTRSDCFDYELILSNKGYKYEVRILALVNDDPRPVKRSLLGNYE